MKKIIIINADDYGLTPAVSKGIRLSYKQGILTSTTALASGLSIEADAKLLQSECPDMGLGAHLALTSFKPVLPKEEIPSLLTPQGSFFKLDQLIVNQEQIDKDELYAEWKAQILKLQSYGLLLDHIDSHHHVAFLNRKTIKVLCDLALEFNLPVRSPVHSNGFSLTLEEAKKLLQDKEIKFPEGFYDEFSKQKGNRVILKKLLNSSEETFEILSHAGIVDEGLLNVSSLTYSRELELDALCDLELKNWLGNQRNLVLGTFKNLYYDSF